MNDAAPSPMAEVGPGPLDFMAFPKMARLNREVVITEKIDGTNAQILIIPPPPGYDPEDPANEGIWLRNGLLVRAGSRTRWISPGKNKDNAGFAAWVQENAEELTKLGEGRHFGEWWGASIQRRYGPDHKRFSLFNVGRWEPLFADGRPGVYDTTTRDQGPSCCFVVPTIWRGVFDQFDCRACLNLLTVHGSFAAPGFRDPEGIVVYHEAAKKCFKVTVKDDEIPKSLVVPGV